MIAADSDLFLPSETSLLDALCYFTSKQMGANFAMSDILTDSSIMLVTLSS